MTSQVSLFPAALSQFDLELENTLEDHEVSLQITGDMLAVELETIGAASQRNRVQQCRGTIGASALSFCGILPLQLNCRLTVRTSPSFWT